VKVQCRRSREKSCEMQEEPAEEKAEDGKWYSGGSVYHGTASWDHGPMGGSYGHVGGGGVRWGHCGGWLQEGECRAAEATADAGL